MLTDYSVVVFRSNSLTAIRPYWTSWYVKFHTASKSRFELILEMQQLSPLEDPLNPSLSSSRYLRTRSRPPRRPSDLRANETVPSSVI